MRQSPATTREAESVVRVIIDRTRVLIWLIWLILSITLSGSAVLIAVAQTLSMSKTIPNAMLALLSMNLFEMMSRWSCKRAM